MDHGVLTWMRVWCDMMGCDTASSGLMTLVRSDVRLGRARHSRAGLGGRGREGRGAWGGAGQGMVGYRCGYGSGCMSGLHGLCGGWAGARAGVWAAVQACRWAGGDESVNMNRCASACAKVHAHSLRAVRESIGNELCAKSP